jgi:hypothetical protein
MYRPGLEALENRLAPGDLLNTSVLWRVDGFLSNSDPGLLAAPPQAVVDDAATGGAPQEVVRAARPVTPFAESASALGNVAVPANDYSWASFLTALGAPAESGGATVAGVGAVSGVITENYCIPEPPFGFGTRGAAGVVVWLYMPEGYVAITVSGEDGSFSFGGAPASDNYYILAYVDSFGEAWGPTTVPASGTSSTSLHLPFAVPGQMIVGYETGTTAEQIAGLEAAYGLTRLSVIGGSFYVYRIAYFGWTDDTIAAYEAEPLVRFAERNSFACLA